MGDPTHLAGRQAPPRRAPPPRPTLPAVRDPGGASSIPPNLVHLAVATLKIDGATPPEKLNPRNHSHGNQARLLD
jgi:hypothetical protein